MCIYPASITEGDEFFERFWPEARAVSDPEGTLYKALGVRRASLRQMLGPGVWFRAIQAVRAGYSIGKIVGNPWLLPGIFLVHSQEIRWAWTFNNIGDQPNFDDLAKTVRSLIGPR